MVVSENEILAEVEVDSPLPQDQHHKNQAFSSIGRQSSIYSLTLDEFQLTLCDGGKNFGSMNMDEFLNSIWTAEENQAINGNNNPPNNAITSNNNNNNNNNNPNNAITSSSNNNNDNSSNHNNNVGLSLGEASSQKVIAKQPILVRQGSLTLPPPLCRKTVDEVWSEIHKSQQQGRPRISTTTAQGSGSGSAARQATFGEMTLEDFLVKAGVVREQGTAPVPPPPQQQFGMYQNSNHPSMGGPTFVSRAPMMGMAAGGGGGGSGGAASVAATYPTMSHGGGGVGESSVYGKRNGAYHAPPVCYSGGRMGNGGGYGQAQAMGVETASPVSPDGIGTSQVDSGPNQYGMDVGGSRGRKRIGGDGPVEKVVERRQRRMIKNRESAARSRARKQAYTVELEAELNQLREENAHLKQTLAELERKRKQQYFEEVKMRTQTMAQKAKERLGVMRRTLSCPL